MRALLFACIAIGFGSSLVGCGASDSAASSNASDEPAAQPTPFLVLRAGQHALLKTDGGTATVGTVCSSPTAMEQWFANGGASTPGCVGHKPGEHVIVDGLAKQIAVQTMTYKLVRVHAANRRWSGYETTDSIDPILPLGTIVTLKSNGDLLASANPADEASLDREPNRDSFKVAGDSIARVVGWKDDVENDGVQVQITSGPDKGTVGWTYVGNLVIGSQRADGFLASAPDVAADPDDTANP